MFIRAKKKKLGLKLKGEKTNRRFDSESRIDIFPLKLICYDIKMKIYRP